MNCFRLLWPSLLMPLLTKPTVGHNSPFRCVVPAKTPAHQDCCFDQQFVTLPGEEWSQNNGWFGLILWVELWPRFGLQLDLDHSWIATLCATRPMSHADCNWTHSQTWITTGP